jgi:uncharacterized protein YbjT (DUF2867 family)
MSGQRIVVAGGSGFLGTHLVEKLIEAGYTVAVPTRRRDRAKHLAIMPGVELVETNLRTDQAVSQLLEGASAVINLVGILHGRSGQPSVYGPDFATAHVDLPKRLADVCVAKGIRRFIHMSALGVTADGKRNLPSRYLRSRAAGEQALRSTLGLDLTVLRPSVIFGREDKFLNVFAQLLSVAPLMTLPRPNTRFAPVWVEDVARATLACLQRTQTIGQTYELVGPQIYTLRELVVLVGKLSGHDRPLIGLPDVLGRLQALAVEMVPGPPLMSRDNFDSMKIDNVSSVGWNETALGFVPTPLAMIAPTYLNAAVASRFDPFRAKARR